MIKKSNARPKARMANSEIPRRKCPSCGDIMQKSGQKVDSNHVVKQRYLCKRCKKTGKTPYNYFILVSR